MLRPSHTDDPIAKVPDIAGTAGKAWQIDLKALRQNLGCSERDDAMVAVWVVEAPFANPFWHSYAMVLVHLRPLADARPTKFYLDGATHEMWLAALNPDVPRARAILGMETWAPLAPLNFAAQIKEASDDAAQGRIRDAVSRVCTGTLNPDTDFIRQWMHLFGDNMIKGDKKAAGETRVRIDDLEIVIPPQPGPQDRN